MPLSDGDTAEKGDETTRQAAYCPTYDELWEGKKAMIQKAADSPYTSAIKKALASSAPTSKQIYECLSDCPRLRRHRVFLVSPEVRQEEKLQCQVEAVGSLYLRNDTGEDQQFAQCSRSDWKQACPRQIPEFQDCKADFFRRPVLILEELEEDDRFEFEMGITTERGLPCDAGCKQVQRQQK